MTTIPSGFKEEEIIQTIQYSMDKWTAELPLEFVYIGRHQNANITVGFFESVYHTVWRQGAIKNCTFPFKRNTLAHAHGLHHPPDVRGQIHFNGLYRWSL